LTVNPLLVLKSLLLLRMVPCHNEPISQRQRRSRVCSPIQHTLACSHSPHEISPVPRPGETRTKPTYNSSQLYIDLANVVSMCLTNSLWNSSLLENSFAANCFHASRRCFGMDASTALISLVPKPV